MRMMSLVFSFVVTVTVATVALAYVTERVGQKKIRVQDGWISSEPSGYQAYGQLPNPEPDSIVKPVADSDTAKDLLK